MTISMLLANLQIDMIILHEVFRRGDDRKIVAPKFSLDFTKLGNAGLNTLRERIVGVLGDDTNSLEMIINKADAGSAFEVFNQMVGADTEFIMDGSRKLAEKLTVSQRTRGIPGGILVVFTGLTGKDNHSYVGIIKAELHGGFNLQEKRDYLQLEYLEKLLLTPQQKLYKIAMLIDTSNAKSAERRSPEHFRVLVYDHLMKSSRNGEAAQYFYEDFLGCTYLETPQTRTKDFYYLTKEYIDSIGLPAEERIDQDTYLYTYLKGSKSKTISVDEFSKEYLPLKYRDGYKTFMEERNFPLRAVAKDLTYLQRVLTRRNIRFTSGVKLNAPSEKFSELVKIRGEEGGKTIVEISGSVDKVE